MSTIFNNKQIAEHALRRVGAFAVHDTGADPDEFSVAIDCLDMLVAEIVALKNPLWLRKVATVIAIPINTNPLDVITLAGPTVINPNNFQFIRTVSLRDPQGNDQELTRISSREYMGIENKAATGTPCSVYVDKQRVKPLFYLDRQLIQTGWSLCIEWITMGPDIKGFPTGDHGFPQAWQRCLVRGLAYEIGSGPVVHLEQGRAAGYQKDYLDTLDLLMGMQNVSTDQPALVKFEDF